MNSKQIGNEFENLFKKIGGMRGIGCLRINDGFRRIGGGFIPVKNACDWVLFYHSFSALIDTKTQESGKSFAKGHVDFDQIHAMLPYSLDHNVVTGYVVYFRNENKVVFFSCKQLLLDQRSIDDGILLGPIEDCDIRKIWPAAC